MLGVSLIIDPKKLRGDIDEKFFDTEEGQGDVVTMEDSFNRGVMTKLLSRNYENLLWIAEKTKFTLHRLRIRNERPAITSPFMPIAGQVPIEFGKLTVPHVTCPSCKYHASYGSIRVKVQEEKQQEKSTNNNNERIPNNHFNLDEGDADRRRCSSSNSSNDKITFGKLSSLTTKEWVTICMLSVANLGSTSAYSCIAPFYSKEAKIKGLKSFEIGIVFGIFELMMLFVAPLFGKYMILIGSKRMFVSGIGITGITAILFGFLNYIESSSLFFWSSISLRTVEALADAAFVTSSFAIGVKCFPERVAIIVGVMETFAGLGSTAGPLLGGILYEIGGFRLPFLTLGIVLLFLGLLAYFLVERMDDDDVSLDGKGILGMLKIPVLWIMIYSVIMCAMSLSFLDPTLADHLESFKLTPSIIGLMFLFSGGTYTVTAPFWSIIIDKFNCSKAIIMFGIVATIFSMIIIGPSPFLNAKKSLAWIEIALGVLGLAGSALYIPTFQMSINAVREYGYNESLQTYGSISGLFQCAYSLGSFVGPTLGGLCVHWIGFPWTTTIIALLNITFVQFFQIADRLQSLILPFRLATDYDEWYHIPYTKHINEMFTLSNWNSKIL